MSSETSTLLGLRGCGPLEPSIITCHLSVAVTNSFKNTDVNLYGQPAPSQSLRTVQVMRCFTEYVATKVFLSKECFFKEPDYRQA